MNLKVIHQLQAFSNAIRQTFVQHFTRFQLTLCSPGSSALAELLVDYNCTTHPMVEMFGRAYGIRNLGKGCAVDANNLLCETKKL